MNRYVTRLTVLCGLLLTALGPPGAAATPEHVSGVVLSLLSARREAVVRLDAVGSKPSVTRLFHLGPDVSVARLHDGDAIVANVLDRPGGPQLQNVVVEPPSAPHSIVKQADLLRVGQQLPQRRFVDQLGRSFGFSDFYGKSVVLAFVYTRCRDPKECPLVSSNFHTLQARFGNGPYHLVEMTMDPGYDRPRVLARYGTVFGADPKHWTLGTGDSDQVLDFERRFAIDPFYDPHVGLIHTERVVLIGPNGKIVDFIDQSGFDVDDIIARLRAADALPSNPIARLDFELSKGFVAICGNRVAGFSGLADLGIVLVIVLGGAWFLQRLARKIFVEQI